MGIRYVVDYVDKNTKIKRLGVGPGHVTLVAGIGYSGDTLLNY